MSTLTKRGTLIDIGFGVVRVDFGTFPGYIEVTIHSQAHLTKADDGTTLSVPAETACALLTIEAARELRDALDEALKQKEPAPEPQPARTPGPNDVPGCEFVRLLTCCEGSYIHPGGDTDNETDSAPNCQCGAGYCVSKTFHWHIDGICHNLTRCHGAEGGK